MAMDVPLPVAATTEQNEGNAKAESEASNDGNNTTNDNNNPGDDAECPSQQDTTTPKAVSFVDKDTHDSKITKPPNHFFRLPAELRFLIWPQVLAAGVPIPVSQSTRQIHRPYFIVEYSRECAPRRVACDMEHHLPAAKAAVRMLNALLQTCRLFWHDQESQRSFYSHNNFHFGGEVELATYIAAITPDRRSFIQHITVQNSFCRTRHDNDPVFATSIPRFKLSDMTSIVGLCNNLRIIDCTLLGWQMSPFYTQLSVCLIALAKSSPQLEEFRISSQRNGSPIFHLRIAAKENGGLKVTMGWAPFQNTFDHIPGMLNVGGNRRGGSGSGDSSPVNGLPPPSSYDWIPLQVFGEDRADPKNNPFTAKRNRRQRAAAREHSLTKKCSSLLFYRTGSMFIEAIRQYPDESIWLQVGLKTTVQRHEPKLGVNSTHEIGMAWMSLDSYLSPALAANLRETRTYHIYKFLRRLYRESKLGGYDAKSIPDCAILVNYTKDLKSSEPTWQRQDIQDMNALREKIDLVGRKPVKKYSLRSSTKKPPRGVFWCV